MGDKNQSTPGGRESERMEKGNGEKMCQFLHFTGLKNSSEFTL